MTPEGIAARLAFARTYEQCGREFAAPHVGHHIRISIDAQIAFCPVCKLVWTPGRGIEAVEALGP